MRDSTQHKYHLVSQDNIIIHNKHNLISCNYNVYEFDPATLYITVSKPIAKVSKQ